MGCDIHLFVEAKVNDQWILMNHPATPRNYELFELLAGVRGDEGNALVSPRGLPKDISVGVGLEWEYGGSDWHTPSWLTPKELGEVVDEMEKRFEGYKQRFEAWEYFGFFFGNYIWDFPQERKFVPQSIQDVRVVFWFDN